MNSDCLSRDFRSPSLSLSLVHYLSALSVFLYLLSLYVFLSVCLFLALCIPASLCLCLSVCVSVCLCVCLSVSLSPIDVCEGSIDGGCTIGEAADLAADWLMAECLSGNAICELSILLWYLRHSMRCCGFLRGLR